MKTLTWQKPGQQNVAQELIKIIINYVAELRFIVKMEGFAGFVGLMFGLVVLSVIITLVVCAVKRHRREWLQDGQRRV
uniref:hypothetical protein n=1 Tax=Alistipes putredinis TaxID=28117 RepID=UPI003FD855D2